MSSDNLPRRVGYGWGLKLETGLAPEIVANHSLIFLFVFTFIHIYIHLYSYYIFTFLFILLLLEQVDGIVVYETHVDNDN